MAKAAVKTYTRGRRPPDKATISNEPTGTMDFDTMHWIKKENLYRVPKDLCPKCNKKTKVIKNGYDIIDKGTPNEKRIQRYTCKECGKHYRERDYASPKILMARQSVILWLLGWTNQAIAETLEIDVVSVSRYLRRYLKGDKAREIRRSQNEEPPKTENIYVLPLKLVTMYKDPTQKKKAPASKMEGFWWKYPLKV